MGANKATGCVSDPSNSYDLWWQQRPGLQRDHGPSHGPWQQPDLDVTITLGGSAQHSEWHSPSGSVVFGHQHGLRSQGSM